MPPAYEAEPAIAPEPGATVGLGTPGQAAALLEPLIGEILAGGVPGAAAAIVHQGAVLLAEGYGVADVRTRTKVDADTVFRVGSVSKLVTWTALMQAVERGAFGPDGLDAEIDAYCAPLVIPDAFGERVRVWNLFTHTAGFDDNQLGYLVKRTLDQRPLAEVLQRHQPRRIARPTTVARHAHEAAYCGWAASLAGHLAANASRTDFDTCVERDIFQPLRMDHSTFREPLPAHWRCAAGHEDEGAGPQARDFEFLHTLAPDGALSTTAADMARFMLAHLEGGSLEGTRILRPESVAALHARQLAADAALDGATLGYCEWHLNGRRLLVHGGRTLHFSAFLMLVPDERAGFFLAFNAMTGRSPERLATALADRYFPATMPPPPPSMPAAGLRRFAGTYAANNHSRRTLEKARLLIERTEVIEVRPAAGGLAIENLQGERSSWRGVPGAPGLFCPVEGAAAQAPIAFVQDESGRVTHLLQPMAFAPAYRLRWAQTPAFHRTLLCASFSVAAAALLLGLAASGRWHGLYATAWLSTLILLVVEAVSLRIVWTALRDPLPLLYEYPRRVHLAVGALATLGVPLAAAGSGLFALTTLFEEAPAIALAGLGAATAAGVVVLLCQNYWNMVGRRFA